jgi:hypothetical protein
MQSVALKGRRNRPVSGSGDWSCLNGCGRRELGRLRPIRHLPENLRYGRTITVKTRVCTAFGPVLPHQLGERRFRCRWGVRNLAARAFCDAGPADGALSVANVEDSGSAAPLGHVRQVSKRFAEAILLRLPFGSIGPRLLLHRLGHRFENDLPVPILLMV